jgi:hypothetical protein
MVGKSSVLFTGGQRPVPRATLINLWPDFSPQSALPYYFSRFPAENALF